MVKKIEPQSFQSKRLGTYLIEAELITPEQLNTALKTQQLSGEQLGKILATHGFVKQQTIEYLMSNIVLPERNKILKNQSYSNNRKSDHLSIVESGNSIKPENAMVGWQSAHHLQIYLSANKTFKFLLVVVLLFAVVSLIANYNVYYLPDFLGRDLLRILFDLNSEDNIPTIYSGTALLFCSILTEIVFQAQKSAKNKDSWAWRGLSIVFAGLSLDELIGLHERLTKPLGEMFNTGGFLYYAWVIGGAVFVFVFLLVFGRFIIHLPRKTRRLFLIAGTVYVSGAIGTELIGGYYHYYYTSNSMLYSSITTVEEVLEMLGVIIFIYALLSYINSNMKGIDIGIHLNDGKKQNHRN
ncbi:hypothetical protein VF14_36490 [Nostoc linckia z18]|uniref:Uncharacterized protein n=2 Tax=Nostoc linckia TaxID=92942 RepID=A0A9Q5Z499_NOSLI|nr:hypothetical protein [Nostoc linckia]PHK33758.1 hypothetical protein VF12_24930 [Nostoc linckia z15]PHK44137.1 hypothetical protein VF13_23565 [Nostoc linckia z16]PHJ56933.1 hypothetical protein VF02_31690 [Nostoc linckia z1]PHJ59101.1 hypothetical protein VF05_32840 [Nostoc linckia z3]PHJ62891.1 hypothetical protein VF03_30940 [Nostoc linckia z2]